MAPTKSDSHKAELLEELQQSLTTAMHARGMIVRKLTNAQCRLVSQYVSGTIKKGNASFIEARDLAVIVMKFVNTVFDTNKGAYDANGVSREFHDYILGANELSTKRKLRIHLAYTLSANGKHYVPAGFVSFGTPMVYPDAAHGVRTRWAEAASNTIELYELITHAVNKHAATGQLLAKNAMLEIMQLKSRGKYTVDKIVIENGFEQLNDRNIFRDYLGFKRASKVAKEAALYEFPTTSANIKHLLKSNAELPELCKHAQCF